SRQHAVSCCFCSAIVSLVVGRDPRRHSLGRNVRRSHGSRKVHRAPCRAYCVVAHRSATDGNRRRHLIRTGHIFAVERAIGGCAIHHVGTDHDRHGTAHTGIRFRSHTVVEFVRGAQSRRQRRRPSVCRRRC